VRLLRNAIWVPYRLLRYCWHVWARLRPAARARGVSVWRLVREQVALKRRRGLTPAEYFYYGLDDPSMPWEEKLTYVGGSLHRKLLYLMTPARYHCCFDNKLLFKRLFGSLGFPVARLLGVYDPAWGHTADGAPLRTPGDMGSWMFRCRVQEAVFKPIESGQGRMVLVVSGRNPRNEHEFLRLDGTPCSPEAICAFLSDRARLREAYPDRVPMLTFLVEERLRPHMALRELVGETLSCARVTTLTSLTGEVTILETAVKLQPQPTGVDNVAQGSIAVAVDQQTGVLGTGLYHGEPTSARRTHFRDSDVRFEGFKVPMWDEVIRVARSAALAFPYAHTVGWDIGVTDDGPYLVEGNPAWGNFQAECGAGLMRGAFGELVTQLRNVRRDWDQHLTNQAF